MKLSTLILPAIAATLWGLLAWIFHGGLAGVEARVGHTKLAQVDFYLTFPLIMVIVAAVPSVLLSQTKWSSAGNMWSIFMILALAFYFPQTGAMRVIIPSWPGLSRPSTPWAN